MEVTHCASPMSQDDGHPAKHTSPESHADKMHVQTTLKRHEMINADSASLIYYIEARGWNIRRKPKLFLGSSKLVTARLLRQDPIQGYLNYKHSESEARQSFTSRLLRVKALKIIVS